MRFICADTVRVVAEFAVARDPDTGEFKPSEAAPRMEFTNPDEKPSDVMSRSWLIGVLLR
jgi:hypothetical protein